MKRFKNILLVQKKTHTKTALGRALSLAEMNGAHLKIIDVFEAFPEKLLRRLRRKYSLDVRTIAQAEFHERVNKLVSKRKNRAVQIQTKVLFGTPFIEIIREVLHGHHDLVVTEAEGQMALRERLFGTTNMHLMRKCPCPVWVIRPGRSKRFSTILAAVDVSSSHKEEDKVNTKIIELASSLAKLEKGKLHILHCWEEPLERTSMRRTGLSQSEIRELVSETRQSHENLFKNFIERFDLKEIEYHWHLLKGDPGELIPDLARKKRADLVVMGTLSRSGIAGLLIGNTAETVLNQIDSSVLTVKPDEFKTPIKV